MLRKKGFLDGSLGLQLERFALALCDLYLLRLI